MALVGNELYVANADAVVRFPYKTGETSITRQGRQGGRPAGRPINHHWTKNLVASQDGKQLYVTVGSNSNVGENGMDSEEGRAAIWEFDRATGKRPRLRLAACAIRSAWPGSRRAARCGPRSTSATSSATTWCPTT